MARWLHSANPPPIFVACSKGISQILILASLLSLSLSLSLRGHMFGTPNPSLQPTRPARNFGSIIALPGG